MGISEINFKDIKMIASDFDGVMTDNKVKVDEMGKESVICSRSDGLGIELLKKTGIDFIVISREKNPVVEARCKKLKVNCIQGIDNKHKLLVDEVKKRNLNLSRVCFIGNDVNDIECIKAAGIGVAVADAHPDAIKSADFVTEKRGGEGAVREIIDKIMDCYPLNQNGREN